MSTGLATLAADKATMRWREPYVSDGLNRKFHGPIPRGVVRGGNLVASLPVMTVDIAPDPVTGDSVYTYANADGRQVTVREIGTTTLNLNVGGIPGTTVYIGLEVDYTTAADTEANWRAYSQAEIDIDEKIIVIGKVVVPAAGSIPAANISPDRRRDAWQDRSVGMRDWRQIVESGSVDLPVPGKAADRWFPYWSLTATGSATIEHSSSEKRSMTHSIRVGGTSGQAVIAPSSGNDNTPPLYPVRAGQRIMYSFYVKTDNWTYDTDQFIGFAIRDAPTSGAAITVELVDFTNNGPDVGWVHVTGVIAIPSDGWFMWSILTTADAANAGYLYLDDIRVWMESGIAAEDPGQAFLMGINRQISGSALALFLGDLPDSEETWANSTIRLINTSSPAGGSISARMTADPVNGVDLFDWRVDANMTIKGTVLIEPPSGEQALTVYASGARAIEAGSDITAIRARSTNGYAVDAASPGGTAIIAATNAVGAEALHAEGLDKSIYALADGTGLATRIAAIEGYAIADSGQAGYGLYGRAGGAGNTIGVFGLGASSGGTPTVREAGGVFWGENAVEPYYMGNPAYQAPFTSSVQDPPEPSVLRPGLVVVGGEHDYNYAGHIFGKVSQNTYVPGGHGLYIRGGDGCGDPNVGQQFAGGDALVVRGGNRDDANSVGGWGGRGIVAYGGVGGTGAGYNRGGGAAGEFYGGNGAGGTNAYGGEGLKVYGGTGIGDRRGGHGLLAYGGEADETVGGSSGYGVYAIFSPSSSSHGGIGLRARGQGGLYRLDVAGAAIDTEDASDFRDALFLNSGIRFYRGKSQDSSQNPLATSPLFNTLKAINVPKAWGLITCGTVDAEPTLFDGFNIIDVTYVVGVSPGLQPSARIQVTLAGGMLGTYSYVVTPSVVSNSLSTANYVVRWSPISTNVFFLQVVNANTGNEIVLKSSGITLAFSVMGRQTLIDYESKV